MFFIFYFVSCWLLVFYFYFFKKKKLNFEKLCWLQKMVALKKVHGNNSEHGERGGGVCNAIGEKSASLSARSMYHQRRGSPYANPV